MDDDKSDESFKICVKVMQNHNKLDDAEWNATIEQNKYCCSWAASKLIFFLL